MGDELHMRSQATGALLLRFLAPGLAALGSEDVTGSSPATTTSSCR